MSALLHLTVEQLMPEVGIKWRSKIHNCAWCDADNAHGVWQCCDTFTEAWRWKYFRHQRQPSWSVRCFMSWKYNVTVGYMCVQMSLCGNLTEVGYLNTQVWYLFCRICSEVRRLFAEWCYLSTVWSLLSRISQRLRFQRSHCELNHSQMQMLQCLKFYFNHSFTFILYFLF